MGLQRARHHAYNLPAESLEEQVFIGPVQASPQPQVLRAISWMKVWIRVNLAWLLLSLAAAAVIDRLANLHAILILPFVILFSAGAVFCMRVKAELQAGKTEIAQLGRSLCWFVITAACLAMSYLMLATHASLVHHRFLEAAIEFALLSAPLGFVLLSHRTALSLTSAIDTLAKPSQTFGFPLVEAADGDNPA